MPSLARHDGFHPKDFPLRIVFAGTPDFAAHHLNALIDANFEVVAAYTQPDRPAGRGKKLQASPVKQLALEHNIPVFQPTNFKAQEDRDALAALHADVMVVVAYGLLLPQDVLDTPTHGCINVHGSLLPRWRGAAPIQRAIWAGDAETGVTIMQMNAGLDTGDMLHKVIYPIKLDDTSTSVYNALAQSGPLALIDTLTAIDAGKVTPEPQDDSLASYAKKLSKQEALLDWTKPADALEREVRAFNPWPVSYTVMQGNNVKVWQASVADETTTQACGTIISADKNGIKVAAANGSIFVITSLQPPGKKPMNCQDFLNGRADWLASGTLQTSNNDSGN